MTRDRNLAVYTLATVIVGLFLWWALLRDPPVAPGERGGRTTRTRDRDVEREGAVPAPSADRDVDLPPSRRSPGTEGAPTHGDAATAEVPMVHGVAVLEDGTPLQGVAVESGAGLSDATGSIRFPRPAGPVVVQHPFAHLVSAEGGTVLGEFDAMPVRLRADGDRVRMVFRPLSWFALVRLVDAQSGAPVTDVTDLRMAWEFDGGALVIRVKEDPGLGGWIAVREGKLPEGAGIDPGLLRIDPAKVTLGLSLPGYETARLPLPEVRGRREVPVNPVDPDARGVVDLPKETAERHSKPGSYVAEWDVEVATPAFIANPFQADLRSLDSPPQPRPQDLMGMPRAPGPFRLFGLPDGAWEIEVFMTLPDGTSVRGKKAFERRGGTAEIGAIELKEGGTIRMRVVDAAEKPMPQAWIVAVRPEEDPDQGRHFAPDAQGRLVIADLEPGLDHRVQVRGLPRLLEEIVRPAPDRSAKEVEFRWAERLVPCRIRLSVDGRVVANPDGGKTIPASIHESPLPRDRGTWGTDGTFEAPLVPGTYRFSAYATPKEGTGLALFAGEVTVVAGTSFEASLDLKRER